MVADRQYPRVLLVKAPAGMGNRLLGLLTAILYGRLTGRQLVVDWCDPPYSRNGENVFPLLFARPASSLTPTELHGRSTAPEAWIGHQEAPVCEQVARIPSPRLRPVAEVHSVDPGRLDYTEDVVVYWSHVERIHQMRLHFKGEFRHLARSSDEQILRDLLRTEVVPRPDILAQVDRFRRLHFDGEVVGIHLRNSDLSVSVEKILRHADKILASRGSARVFVATDNSDTLQQARQRYGADRLLATEKWFPNPGQPIHHSSDRADQLQIAREALVDLYLLGACDWLAGDWRSSFVYVASLLFDGPRSRVRNFDPGRIIPRHLGHRLGIYRMMLRREITRRKRSRTADPAN